MEILRNNQKEILEIKNTGKGMKNAVDGLISRLTMTKESHWAWGQSIASYQIQMRKKKEKKKKIFKNSREITKGVTYK